MCGKNTVFLTLALPPVWSPSGLMIRSTLSLAAGIFAHFPSHSTSLRGLLVAWKSLHERKPRSGITARRRFSGWHMLHTQPGRASLRAENKEWINQSRTHGHPEAIAGLRTKRDEAAGWEDGCRRPEDGQWGTCWGQKQQEGSRSVNN